MAGIRFLTEVGQICSDHRQEFILLSDTLGLSMLVDLINHGAGRRCATESTVLGPFYVPDSPMARQRRRHHRRSRHTTPARQRPRA